MTPTQKDLIDTDGENRAVRAFLLGREVGCKDYEQMRRHMTNSGFNNCWPSEFAGLGGHMSKGDQQMWLRHLFALERLGALAEQPAEQEPVAQRWQPIETAPKGRIVLVYYKNSLGNGRTMRARYYLPETLDSDTTESGWADEGWYEESEAYEYLMPLEHDPTHWMPLPAGPDTAPQPKAEQQAAHYGIIDPDYARVFTQARIIAHQYGYACVMHGSFTRDLDLLMVPWTEQATDNREQLLKLIAGACGLRFRDGNEDVIKSNPDFTIKPHGRTACSLYFPKFGDHRWVDISFVPCVPQPAKRVPLADSERIDWLAKNPVEALDIFGHIKGLDAERWIRQDIDRAIERAHGIGGQE